MVSVMVPRQRPFSCKCADGALAGVVQHSVWLLTTPGRLFLAIWTYLSEPLP